MTPDLLIVALSTLTVTAYQPIPAQTKPECVDRYHCQTSIDDNVTMYGAAISQDLLKSGTVKYGDVLDIPGFGLRVVNDVMGPTKCVKRNEEGRCTSRVVQTKAVDLMVFSYQEEHHVGIRYLPVTRIRQHTGDEQWNTKHAPIAKKPQAVAHAKVYVIPRSFTTKDFVQN